MGASGKEAIPFYSWWSLGMRVVSEPSKNLVEVATEM
jgi:hypothetical protein